MPVKYRRPYRPRRRPRKRTMTRKPTFKMAKPLKPKTYFFKRCFSEVVQLNTQSPPLGWSVTGNALYRQFVYKLSDLAQYTDFTNLFNQYKLTGVKIQLLFSNTQSGQVANTVSTAPQVLHSNSQVIMWIAPNPTGVAQTVGPDEMLKISAHKKRLCLNGGKPITVYRKLKQLQETHGGAGNTDFAFVNPRLISTSEPHTLHYGQNICLERADQGLFANNSTNYQSVRIIYTYYIMTRQVE